MYQVDYEFEKVINKSWYLSHTVLIIAKHNNKKKGTEKRNKKNPDGINKNAVFNCSHVLY